MLFCVCFLTVAPTVLTMPKNDTISTGMNLTISVEVSAGPNPIVFWQLNGINISVSDSQGYTISMRLANTTYVA